MPSKFKDEAGFVSAVVLMFILVASILFGSLLTIQLTTNRFTTRSEQLITAQAAAEAGVKRALVGFYNNRTDWEWANNLTKNPFAGDASQTYQVKLEPQISNGNTPQNNQTYKITAIGRNGSFQKTVTCTIKTEVGIPSDAAIYVKDDFTAKNNMEIDGSIVAGGTISGNIYINGTKVENAKIDFPTIDYNKYKNENTSFPNLGGSKKNNSATINLTQNKYYVDGDLDVTSNQITINGKRDSVGNYEPTVIFVNGNVNIEKNGLTLNGRFIFITTKDFNIGKNNPDFNEALIVAKGNVNIEKNNATITGGIICEGDIYFKNNGLVKKSADYQLNKEFNAIMSDYLDGTPSTNITNWSDK